MPEAYDLHEGRLLQYYTLEGAPDAITLPSAAVPDGKVWTIISLRYIPSASETRAVWFYILGKDSVQYPITAPTSILLSSVIPHCGISEGMEIKIYPGEAVGVSRDVATAGSNMRIGFRFIETDLPYYSQIEPLKKVFSSKFKHGSIMRRPVGGGGGGVGESGGSDVGGGGGRDTGSIPI